MRLKFLLRITFHLILFSFFTVLTQVGGLVHLSTLLFTYCIKSQVSWKKYYSPVIFLMLYLLSTFLILPLLAPVFGRTALPLSGNLKPLNYGFCLLNRHYVTPDLEVLMQQLATEMDDRFPGTTTYYLDANFPFWDGFPLAPHLSHDDGRKLDLAFYYMDPQSGKPKAGSPTRMGYGSSEGPGPGEVDLPSRCAEQGFWQYSLIQALLPHGSIDTYELDVKRTAVLVRRLAMQDAIEKIFLEPHLKERWRLQEYGKIRFQGCHSVRHDDHIHLQIH